MFLLTVAALSCWVLFVKGQPQSLLLDKLNTKQDILRSDAATSILTPVSRTKRTSDHIISDCIFMTSKEGQYFNKATTEDSQACGIYIFADPDERIEIRFSYLDVPCENGGLVAFVDGWELNGQFFPSPHDHPQPMESRFSEFCGQRKVKQVFVSSQNAALIQYRMPVRGTSFSFSVRFIKNPTPCNILVQTLDEFVTVRNYGKRSNCSISTIFPASIQVIALDVGIASSKGRGMELETGTLHKCHKRGLEDFVEIGGSPGLDNNGMELADTICGMDSMADNIKELIACETATVRLVSSGHFDNSVTLKIEPLTEDDLSSYISVFCPPEGYKK